MPLQKGIKRTQWQLCQRCGLMYPINKLRVQQGLILCTTTCTDNLDNQYRPLIIAQVLSTIGEGNDERSELLSGPGETVVF